MAVVELTWNDTLSDLETTRRRVVLKLVSRDITISAI